MFTRQEKHNEREPEVNAQKQRQARENARYLFSLEFGQILMKQIQRNPKITSTIKRKPLNIVPLCNDFYTVFSELLSHWVHGSQEEFNLSSPGLKVVHL